MRMRVHPTIPLVLTMMASISPARAFFLLSTGKASLSRVPFISRPHLSSPVSCLRLFSTAVLPGESPQQQPHQAPLSSQEARADGPVTTNSKAQEKEDTRPQPADLDEANGFRLGPSVSFWRTFENDVGAASKLSLIAQQTATSLFSGGNGLGMSSIAPKDLLTAQYWAAHLLRRYAPQGLLSAILAAAKSGFSEDNVASRVAKSSLERGGRIFGEALEAYSQDLANIQQGFYKAPYDMNITHRQFNPLFVLDRSSRFLREAVKTLDRRNSQKADPVWLSSGLYPPYYLNTWHYQTDGWLSTESAKVYETSTETLFIGRQDAMQRHTMLPIATWLKENGHAPSGQGLSLLEVACGTGRFLTFLRDNYPEMNMTALDLSPFYLQEARENMRYFESFARRTGRLSPRQPGDNSKAAVTFLQASAEQVPMEDESVDVLCSVYLLHEMPKEVLPAIAKEMARLVKPGGLVVITDSIQLGDRAALNPVLGRFTDFNEPNYDDYIQTDLGGLFQQHGLVPHEKHLISSTKVLSFVKPAATSTQSPPPPSSSSSSSPSTPPSS